MGFKVKARHIPSKSIKTVVHAGLRFTMWTLFGVSTRKKMVEDEQCIVIANHNTHLDICVLFMLFPLKRVNKVRAVAAADYFGTGLKNMLAKYGFNCLLLERHVRGHTDPLKPIRDALEDGDSLIVFPEGTRGQPGVMGHFKSGIGELAIQFPDIPIYPVCLIGIERTLPRSSRLPIPFTVEIQRMDKIYGRDLIAQYGRNARKKISADLETRIRCILDGNANDISQ